MCSGSEAGPYLRLMDVCITRQQPLLLDGCECLRLLLLCRPLERGVRFDIFISQKEFKQSFCKSQFPHKFVNLFLKFVIIKDKLTDLCGNRLLPNEFINTFCEMFRASGFGIEISGSGCRDEGFGLECRDSGLWLRITR